MPETADVIAIDAAAESLLESWGGKKAGAAKPHITSTQKVKDHISINTLFQKGMIKPKTRHTRENGRVQLIAEVLAPLVCRTELLPQRQNPCSSKTRDPCNCPLAVSLKAEILAGVGMLQNCPDWSSVLSKHCLQPSSEEQQML